VELDGLCLQKVFRVTKLASLYSSFIAIKVETAILLCIGKRQSNKGDIASFGTPVSLLDKGSRWQ
jgi:hypothetical protein